MHVIPASARSALNGAVYVVHEPIVGACIGLSRDLKKMLWSWAPPVTETRMFPLKHDCQVTPEGNVMYFDNRARWRDGRMEYAARVVRPDGSEVRRFPTRKEDARSGDSRSGLELGPDGWLISVMDTDAPVVVHVPSNGGEAVTTRLPRHYQDVRRLPFGDFLEKNQAR